MVLHLAHLFTKETYIIFAGIAYSFCTSLFHIKYFFHLSPNNLNFVLPYMHSPS